MKVGYAATLSILLLLVFSSAASAEYLIYLKGGHYIVADNCTFSTPQEIEKDAEAEQKAIPVEDCTKGRPEGHIYWSTIDGKFGEIDANNVYAIYGGKDLAQIRPPRTSMPLEDYLITNRGESFVNAEIYDEKGASLYGFKRDDLAKINRRGVIEIAPEGVAKGRSGEGLCAGEPAEFDVTETELVGTHLVGIFRNLSREMCMPVTIEVEVRQKGRFKGKFPVSELNVVPPGESITFDALVPGRVLEYVKQLATPEASVQLCYRKVLSSSECVRRAGQPIAGQPAIQQPAAK